MIIGVNKGHTLKGPNSGAVGCGYKEQLLTREVGAELEKLLKEEKHTVVDCTVDSSSTNGGALQSIVAKANKQKLDLFVSIHFNACVNDEKGNGKTTGVESYVYSSNSKAKPHSDRICANLAKLGLRNRGTKVNAKLYVIKNTTAPALLVECCFIDDKDDMKLYDAKKFAKAIAEGILNKTLSTKTPSKPSTPSYDEEGEVFYRVVAGSFKDPKNANRIKKELEDKGYDAFIEVFVKNK